MTRRNYWPIAVALLMLLLLAALLIFQFSGSAARENQLGSSTVQDADTLIGLQTELDALVSSLAMGDAVSLTRDIAAVVVGETGEDADWASTSDVDCLLEHQVWVEMDPELLADRADPCAYGDLIVGDLGDGSQWNSEVDEYVDDPLAGSTSDWGDAASAAALSLLDADTSAPGSRDRWMGMRGGRAGGTSGPEWLARLDGGVFGSVFGGGATFFSDDGGSGASGRPAGMSGSGGRELTGAGSWPASSPGEAIQGGLPRLGRFQQNLYSDLFGSSPFGKSGLQDFKQDIFLRNGFFPETELDQFSIPPGCYGPFFSPYTEEERAMIEASDPELCAELYDRLVEISMPPLDAPVPPIGEPPGTPPPPSFTPSPPPPPPQSDDPPGVVALPATLWLLLPLLWLLRRRDHGSRLLA